MTFKSLLPLTVLVALSGQVTAQNIAACGEQPIEPSMVDGATATMEQLVANSAEVNAFIADADIFLDCKEQEYKKNSSSRIRKDQIGTEIKTLTALRNEIGDAFNAQVAAYRAANPQ